MKSFSHMRSFKYNLKYSINNLFRIYYSFKISLKNCKYLDKLYFVKKGNFCQRKGQIKAKKTQSLSSLKMKAE